MFWSIHRILYPLLISHSKTFSYPEGNCPLEWQPLHVPACKLFPRLQTAPAELAQSRGLAALRWLCWRAFEGISLQESFSRMTSVLFLGLKMVVESLGR